MKKWRVSAMQRDNYLWSAKCCCRSTDSQASATGHKFRQRLLEKQQVAHQQWLRGRNDTLVNRSHLAEQGFCHHCSPLFRSIYTALFSAPLTHRRLFQNRNISERLPRPCLRCIRLLCDCVIKKPAMSGFKFFQNIYMLAYPFFWQETIDIFTILTVIYRWCLSNHLLAYLLVLLSLARTIWVLHNQYWINYCA